MTNKHIKLYKRMLMKMLTKAKSFLILLFIISFNIQCFAQFLKEEKLLFLKEREQLKLNKIKSKKKIAFTNDSTSFAPYKKWYDNHEIFYDRNGNEIATIKYYPEQRTIDSLYYDSNNNKIKRIIYQGKNVILYFYDNKNNLFKENVKDFNDSLEREAIYKYDNLNNCIEVLELEKSYTWKHVFLYDVHSNLIEGISYYDNEFDNRTVNKYDNNSNRIESVYFDRNNEINQITNYRFNEANRIIELLQSNFTGDTTIHVYYNYDKKGQLVKEISMPYNDRHGSGSRYGSIKKYRYDKQGLLIEETHIVNKHRKAIYITKYIYSKHR